MKAHPIISSCTYSYIPCSRFKRALSDLWPFLNPTGSQEEEHRILVLMRPYIWEKQHYTLEPTVYPLFLFVNHILYLHSQGNHMFTWHKTWLWSTVILLSEIYNTYMDLNGSESISSVHNKGRTKCLMRSVPIRPFLSLTQAHCGSVYCSITISPHWN